MFYRKQERFPNGRPRGEYVDERASRNNLLFWIWFSILVVATLVLAFYSVRPSSPASQSLDVFDHGRYWGRVRFAIMLMVLPAFGFWVITAFKARLSFIPMVVWTIMVALFALGSVFPDHAVAIIESLER